MMKRRSARIVAVQSLYQIAMNHVSPEEALQTVMEEALNENESETDLTDADSIFSFVKNLLLEITPLQPRLDQIIGDYLQGWQVDRLSRVDREILRLAVFEMLYRADVPPKVAVNEAIELAKHFGTEESGKFVNGVLGKMMGQLQELNK
jgi:N utilization substance protein B